MKWMAALGLLAGFGLSIAACGGGSKSSACNQVGACGGSVVGTWKVTGSCLNAGGNAAMASGISMSCPNASVGNANVSQTGSVTYKADMTFTATTTISGSVSVVLPASCLTQMGVTITCDQLNQVFKSVGSSAGAAGSSGGGLPDIHCSSSGGGCACTTSIPMQTSTTSGTYSTSGSLLTENGSISDYCVQGDKLYVKPHQGTSMSSSMGNVSVNGQVEYQKQ